MTRIERLRGLGLALAVIALPVSAWGQGGSGETPRPPGSDPSARVDQLQGLPPSSPGTTGNPTGRAVDRPANPPASNAVPARPAPGGSGAAGSPNSGGRTGGSSPTN